MSIGNIAIYAIGAVFLYFYITMSYREGRYISSSEDDKRDYTLNKITPDEVFVKGTKGFLVWVAAYAFIVFLYHKYIGFGATGIGITKQGLVYSLIVIAPGVLSYLLGIYISYTEVKKRTK